MTNKYSPPNRESAEIGDRSRMGNLIITWDTKGEVIDVREYIPPRLFIPKQGKVLYANFQRDR